MEAGSHGSAGEADKALRAEQRPGGKEGRRSGGKVERPKAPAPRPQESPIAWVKKADADYSDSEELRPNERRSKARDRRDGLRDRGERKEPWKDRRRRDRRQLDGQEAVAGDDDEGTAASSQVLNGGALLNLLRANHPSATQYSREELLSISQLPASWVKPSSLNTIIDKENFSSPLVMRPKHSRDGTGEEQGEGDSHHNRRGRRKHRGVELKGDRHAESDEEKEGEEDDDDEIDRLVKEFREAKEEDDDACRGLQDDIATEDVPMSREVEEPQWDMPEGPDNTEGDLMEFTLGDIRKAEKSISSGMSMRDYKALLRSGGTATSAGSSEVPDLSTFFGANGADEAPFFEEEAEDVSRASRGFGKWFGNRTEPATSSTAIPGGVAAGWGKGAPSNEMASKAATPKAALPTSSSRSSFESQGLGLGHLGTASMFHGGKPSQFRTMGPIQELAPTAGKGNRRNNRRNNAAGPESPGGVAAGKSILSMLGRSNLPGTSSDAHPTEAPAPAASPCQEQRHAKLSVAELFNLAQGKDLPALPNNANNEAQNAERHAQQEASKMSQFMWLAAQQQQYQQHSQLQAGVRHPGTVPSAHAISAANGGYGAFAVGGDNLFQEAYAQAMLGFGQGVHPIAGGTAMANAAGDPRTGPCVERGGFDRQQASHGWPPQPAALGCPPSANPWVYGAQQPYGMPFGPAGTVGPGGCFAQPPLRGQAPLGGIGAQAATSVAAAHAPTSGLGTGTWPAADTPQPDATKANDEAVEDESGCAQS